MHVASCCYMHRQLKLVHRGPSELISLETANMHCGMVCRERNRMKALAWKSHHKKTWCPTVQTSLMLTTIVFIFCMSTQAMTQHTSWGHDNMQHLLCPHEHCHNMSTAIRKCCQALLTDEKTDAGVPTGVLKPACVLALCPGRLELVPGVFEVPACKQAHRNVKDNVVFSADHIVLAKPEVPKHVGSQKVITYCLDCKQATCTNTCLVLEQLNRLSVLAANIGATD